MVCADIPAHKPFACSVSKRFEMQEAERIAFNPNAAICMGCFGKRSGPIASAAISGQLSTSGLINLRYACLSLPNASAVSSSERLRNAALPWSNGCAAAIGE